MVETQKKWEEIDLNLPNYCYLKYYFLKFQLLKNYLFLLYVCEQQNTTMSKGPIFVISL